MNKILVGLTLELRYYTDNKMLQNVWLILPNIFFYPIKHMFKFFLQNSKGSLHFPHRKMFAKWHIPDNLNYIPAHSSMREYLFLHTIFSAPFSVR